MMELCNSTHATSESALDLFGENRTLLTTDELAPLTNLKEACLLLLDAIDKGEGVSSADTAADESAAPDNNNNNSNDDNVMPVVEVVDELLSRVVLAAIAFNKAMTQSIAQWCAILKPVLDLTRAVYSVGFPLYEQLKAEVNSQWRRPHYPPPLYLRTDLFGLLREVSLLRDLVIPTFTK
eukprot:TRINITY_DN6574_c0_g1_i12.p1 TRINITY_DN6574_c0_g1~~TRINITY_DN6574_c0_g1_i12.p1  ORF type:complete len:180 (+),score=18.46 TRINITY_DN6574_c0_g1_i12:259-798(+)